jgi:post-segregation antitoxin (ccd killing protein)
VKKRNYRGILSVSIDRETEHLLNELRRAGLKINVSKVCRAAIKRAAVEMFPTAPKGEAIVSMVFLGESEVAR